MNSSVGSPRVTRGAALRNHARRARRQRGAVPANPTCVRRATRRSSLVIGAGRSEFLAKLKGGPREIGFRGKSDSSDSFHGRSKNAACTKKTHVGAAPRLPPPPLSPLSRNLRRVSARRTRAYRAIGHRCVSASPAESLSPSPSSSSSAALFGGGGGGGGGGGAPAPAPRRARQNVSRSPAASLVAGRRHAGQLPLTLSHARMHPAWNACAHAMTRTSCPRSISSQHTRHAEVSRSSPKRDAQSPSPAIHRGSDVIVALDAGPGGSSQVASSTPASAVGDAAARIAASSPVVRDSRAESIASPSRWTASREAVSRRGDSPERRSRRSRASTRRRRRPRWPSVTNPGSNVSARVPQQQQCTRNTTGRSMNRNTVTVLAAPLAEEAEDEDEDTRGLS